MSTATSALRLRRTKLRWQDAARGLGLTLAAVVDGVLVSEGRFKYALIFSLVPLGVMFFGRTRDVLLWVLMPALAATLLFGHSFALIRVGPVYVLDAAFFVVVLLTLPALVRAVGAAPGFAAVIGLFGLLTFLHVYEAGITRVVLRQSVIGFYIAWAILGIAVARSGVVNTFMRVVYFGAILAIPIMARGSLHDVAHDLYISFGLALVLFVPHVVGRHRWVHVVAIVQLAVVAVGHVRSIWVAFPLALVTTMVVCGMTPRFRQQLTRIALATVALAIVAVVAQPGTAAKLKSEANSVFNYSGTSVADNNAKWRLGNWSYGISEIQAHPAQGIGFGGPEVPPSVCTTGCNNLSSNLDPTVLAGSDLHNSLLAIPLRMGLPALFVFLAFEAFVFARARRYRRSQTMQWLFTCHLLTGFTALTAVVLEGPYMGVFFWLFAGLVVGYRPDEDAEAELVAPAVPEAVSP